MTTEAAANVNDRGTFVIFLECDVGHIQGIVCQDMGRAWAEGQAGLLDGTSRFYVFPPGPDSIIGKCCRVAGSARVHHRCGANIKAIVLTPDQVVWACTQCGRPQTWDGSGKCSWNSHPDFSCDGVQRVVGGGKDYGKEAGL